MLTFNFWLVGLVQNMDILPTLLGSKWLFLGWGSHLELESVKWTISHPNTWGNIIWGHFCPLHWRVSRYPSRVPDVQKWLCLPKWQAGSRLNCPTWKVSSAPYQIQIHGRARFMTIFALIVGAKEREREELLRHLLCETFFYAASSQSHPITGAFVLNGR